MRNWGATTGLLKATAIIVSSQVGCTSSTLDEPSQDQESAVESEDTTRSRARQTLYAIAEADGLTVTGEDERFFVNGDFGYIDATLKSGDSLSLGRKTAVYADLTIMHPDQAYSRFSEEHAQRWGKVIFASAAALYERPQEEEYDFMALMAYGGEEHRQCVEELTPYFAERGVDIEFPRVQTFALFSALASDAIPLSRSPCFIAVMLDEPTGRMGGSQGDINTNSSAYSEHTWYVTRNGRHLHGQDPGTGIRAKVGIMEPLSGSSTKTCLIDETHESLEFAKVTYVDPSQVGPPGAGLPPSAIITNPADVTNASCSRNSDCNYCDERFGGTCVNSRCRINHASWVASRISSSVDGEVGLAGKAELVVPLSLRLGAPLSQEERALEALL